MLICGDRPVQAPGDRSRGQGRLKREGVLLTHRPGGCPCTCPQCVHDTRGLGASMGGTWFVNTCPA